MRLVILGCRRGTEAALAEGQEPRIKANFINAILDTAVEVSQKELAEALVLQDAEAVTGTFETADFTVAVKLRGRLNGVVFYEFPKGVGSLSPQGRDPYEPFGRDYLAGMGVEELQKIVGAMSEAAAARLATVGYASELGKPLFMGAGATIAIKKTHIRAHFESTIGGMTIRIEVSEAVD